MGSVVDQKKDDVCNFMSIKRSCWKKKRGKKKEGTRISSWESENGKGKWKSKRERGLETGYS